MSKFEPFPFSGPAELNDAWQDFARSYTKSKRLFRRLNDLHLFDMLVFGIPTRIAAQSSPLPLSKQYTAEINSFIRKNTQGDFLKLKNDLQSVMAALANRRTKNPLYKSSVDTLTRMWRHLEVAHEISDLPSLRGLYESPEWKQHETLLKTRAGSLISGGVHTAANYVLEFHSRILSKEFQIGLGFKGVYSLSTDVFLNSLFRYKPDDSSFLHYLSARTHALLVRAIEHSAEYKAFSPIHVSLNAPYETSSSLEEPDALEDLIGDERAKTPHQIAIRSSDHSTLRHVMSQLTAVEQEVLCRRFGIGKFDTPKIQDDVAADMGFPFRQQVQVIEGRALGKLQRWILREHEQKSAPPEFLVSRPRWRDFADNKAILTSPASKKGRGNDARAKNGRQSKANLQGKGHLKNGAPRRNGHSRSKIAVLVPAS